MRLLKLHDVVVYRVGRGHLVPLSEIQARLPPLWASLRDNDANDEEDD